MAHDTSPDGNILSDGETTWLGYTVNQVDKDDNPLQVPHPVPADAKERLTAKLQNTMSQAFAFLAGWAGGTRVAGKSRQILRFVGGIRLGDGGAGTSPVIDTGNGSPEGAVAAPVGSVWLRDDGGTDTTLYRKESGAATANGWVAVSNAGGGGGLTPIVHNTTDNTTLDVALGAAVTYSLFEVKLSIYTASTGTSTSYSLLVAVDDTGAVDYDRLTVDSPKPAPYTVDVLNNAGTIIARCAGTGAGAATRIAQLNVALLTKS